MCELSCERNLLCNKTGKPFASFEVFVLFEMATLCMGMRKDFNVWSLKMDSVFVDTTIPYINACVWTGLQTEIQYLSWCEQIWMNRESVMISCTLIGNTWKWKYALSNAYHSGLHVYRKVIWYPNSGKHIVISFIMKVEHYWMLWNLTWQYDTQWASN